MKLLTVEEVAKRLLVSQKSLYMQVHRKEVPYIKIGGRLRFSEEALLAWLQEKEVQPYENKNAS